MRYSNQQLDDILQAAERLVNFSLEADKGTIQRQLRIDYALARLTLTLLHQLPTVDVHRGMYEDLMH